jgi:hypothetical protein
VSAVHSLTVLFSRRRAEPRKAIEDFWAWWPTARPRVEAAVSGGEWPEALVADISARVSAIHPGLDWEFGQGRTARHVLVVSAAGDHSLRATAERWRRAGPPADEAFEYATTRQPDPGVYTAKLSLDGNTLDLSDLRFGVDVDEQRLELHIAVWHPAFERLPDKLRVKVTYLSLDWVVGEQGVETWIGAIFPVTDPPEGALSAAGLAAAVAEFAEHHQEPTWAVLSGEGPRGKRLATVRLPLKPARWPHLDTHIVLTVPYRDTDGSGMPGEASLAALRALEDRIASLLDGAELVAHETTAGARILHLYADGPVPADALKPLVASWPEGRTRMTVTLDPRWDGVRHLRF